MQIVRTASENQPATAKVNEVPGRKVASMLLVDQDAATIRAAASVID
jgi:hypothetical protein